MTAYGNQIDYAYKCVFDQKSNNMTMYYSKINFDKRSAVITGILGSDSVKILPSYDKITFLETTAVGNQNYTTIFLNIFKNGRYNSVHSRHVTIDNEAVVSQMSGHCIKINTALVYDTPKKVINRKLYCLGNIKRNMDLDYFTYQGAIKVKWIKFKSKFYNLNQKDKLFLNKYKNLKIAVKCFNNISPLKLKMSMSPVEFKAGYDLHMEDIKREIQSREEVKRKYSY